MNRKITKEELISHVESLTAKCEELMLERDELRRKICGYSYDGPRGVAKDLGWDFFKENK